MGKLFLLQKLANGHCAADTEVIRDSIDFIKWKDPQTEIAYEEGRSPQVAIPGLRATFPPSWTIIPVGTLEFANTVLSVCHGHAPVRAINIPSTLQRPEWLQRRISPSVVLDEGIFDVMQCKDVVIKPATICKEFDAVRLTPFLAKTLLPKYEGKTVFASETLSSPIASEWRVFVYRGRVIDIKPYALCSWAMPDKSVVTSMVAAYTDAPPAYTLDVAVLESGATVIMEVHNLISCGLYGFETQALLPNMLAAAWTYELSN